MVRETTTAAVRGVTALVTVAFLSVLGYHLVPDVTLPRLALFGVLGGIALVGAVAVFDDSPYLAAGAACWLLIAGMTQPVLWLYLFPVAGVLLAASLVTATKWVATDPVAG